MFQAFCANAEIARRWIVALLVLGVLSGPVSATWSILIVDTSTGEVAIGIATCLTFFDLRPNTVVVVPGVGVAAAQSFVGPLSLRQLIRAQLLAGVPPSQILANLAAADPGHQSRQYGIVDVSGGVATFTGTGAGPWAGGLTGQTGTLVYSIQGNVLTGMPVISNAAAALVNTPGTMAQKLMAAMEAARVMGGDGRCSCAPNTPTACGAPPPSFTKSSHIGLMIVSRPGDADAACTQALGCGAGTYFMDLNVANQPATAIDPVIQLQALFNAWQTQQSGRPDHFQSSVVLSAGEIPSNGTATTQAVVTLRDALGQVPTTNPTVTVLVDPTSTTTNLQVGPVTAQGGGVYTFDVTAGTTPGLAILNVSAADGLGTPVVVSPRPTLTLGDPFGPAGVGTVDDGLGGFVDVLKIDGSAGVDRITTVTYGQPFTLQLDGPPNAGPPPVGDFYLWVRDGIPSLGENLPLGGNLGTLCFPPPPLATSAATFLLADSFVNAGLLPATTAPWSIGIPGIPAAAEVSLQGVLVESPPGNVAVTNALLLRVELLPAPTLATVTPVHPQSGNTVTLAGDHFLPGCRVLLGSAQVTPSAVAPQQVTFTMPPGVPCDTLVRVRNPDQQTSNGLPISPSPTITNVFFATGPVAGGAVFLVFGTELAGATMTIGGAPATVTLQTNSFVQVTTPPGAVGPALVVVTAPSGCSATTTYTYQ